MVGDTLAATAVIISSAINAVPGSIGLDTEGLIGATAGVIIYGIAGSAITGHALTRVGIITIIIDLAADALIAVLAHHAIGGGDIAAIIAG